ncbi:MAG: Ger(x)C family spore germination protein [Symbiobacteriia bacterium]
MNVHFRFRLGLVAILVLAVMTAGCWDQMETNDLAVVGMAGVDRLDDGQILLTVNIWLPARLPNPASGGGGGGGGGGGTQRPVTTITATGVDVSQAVSRLQLKVPRSVFWGQMQVLALGEDFARSGVSRTLDFWFRERAVRLTTSVIVVPGRAQTFMSGASSELRHLPAEAVREIIRSRAGISTRLQDFEAALASGCQDPVAPRFELVAPDGGDNTRQEPNMTGTALFRDDRLVGWLDPGATRGLLWLRGEAPRSIVTVSLPEQGTVSMRLIRSSSHLTAWLEQGRPVGRLNLEVEDDVDENQADLDLTKPETIAALENDLTKSLEERIRTTFRTLTRDYQVDPMGLMTSLRIADGEGWAEVKDNWRELLPEAELELAVRGRVRRTGRITSPLSKPQGR